MPVISGTVTDTGGSTIQHIELQFSDGSYYLDTKDGLTLTPKLIWHPVQSDFLQENNGVYFITWEFPDLANQPLPLGTYTLTVRAFDFAGNVSEPQSVTLHNVAQARADLSLDFKPTLRPGEALTLQGRLISRRYPPLEENLLDKPLALYAWPEDCEQEAACTWGPLPLPMVSDIGQFYFQIPPLQGVQGKYFLQARFPGDDLLTAAASPIKPLLVGQSAGYAVLVQGRAWIGGEYEGEAAHTKTLNRIYRLLLARGLEKDNIRYFNFDPRQDVDGNGLADDIHAVPTHIELENTFSHWLPARMGDAPLYVVLVDHGDPHGRFYLDPETPLEPAQLNAWLVTMENALSPEALAQPRIVVLGSCYSGRALGTNTGLDLAGRIVITSAAADEESYKGPLEADGIRGGEYFVENLFQALGRGQDLRSAFAGARDLTRRYTRRDSANAPGEARAALQNPQLNVHGEDRSDRPAGADLSLALGVGTELPTNYAGTPADVCAVPAAVTLPAGETLSEFELAYRVNDARRVQNARLEVRRPDTVLSGPANADGPARQREITAVFRAEREAQCSQADDTCRHRIAADSRFQQLHPDAPEITAHSLFARPGRYELQYFVTDSETGDISPLYRSYLYRPEIPPCRSPEISACNPPPMPFALLAPRDEAVTRTDLLFAWEPSRDSEDFTYTLTLATDGALRNVVYQRQDLRQTHAWVDARTVLADCVQGLTDGQRYYWAVAAVDSFGATTLSPVRRFTTDNTNAPVSLWNWNCDTGVCDLPWMMVEISGHPQLYQVDLRLQGEVFTLLSIVPGSGTPDAFFDPATGRVRVDELGLTMELIAGTEPVQFKGIWQ